MGNVDANHDKPMDPYYITNVPKKWTRLFYTRKAAKEALEAMGENVEGVVIEEPDESMNEIESK